MDDRLFYVDSASGLHVSYGQLARDVSNVATVPTLYPFRDGYELFVMLLSAAKLGTTLVLLDDVRGLAGAENELQKYQALTPHPQPLSSEYHAEKSEEVNESSEGNGSFWFDCKSSFRIGMFTSGTTGKPKFVLHSIDSLTRGIRSSQKHQSDVWGLSYHPAHIAGLQVFLQALANHNSLVRLFDLPPDKIHQAIENQCITHLSATPTFYNLICSAKQFHPQVRSVTSGGELSHQALRDRMALTFPNARIQNIYASTEAGSLLISAGDCFQVPQSYQGRIKVIEGQLAIHRSLLATSLQSNQAGEFFPTGDQVEVVDSNPLTIRFTSRQGDWINVGGYKVNPHHVERVLLEMEEVQEALVYGRENSVTGSLVCCDLLLAPGCSLSTSDVHARMTSRIPSYMIPRIVRCVESIKATHTGKKERSS